jgi:methionine-gamma-lyase
MSADHGHAPETKAVHAGVNPNEHRAVTPPIYQTSTFAFDTADQGAELFAGRQPGYIYTRMLNPTVQGLEQALASLEGGAAALACGSGMAAIHTALGAFLKAGDHVVCSDSVYGPTCSLVEKVLPRFGIENTIVDTSDVENVRRALRPNTRVVYVETPGNPTLVVSDIKAIADLAHEHGAIVIADNTFLTPILQRPLELGADIVVHSLTKFLNGHADVIGGAIIAKTMDMYHELRVMLNHFGGVLPPMESFLVHRGLKTLAVRMQRHCESGQRMAEFLEGHPAVAWARYPGLKSHPQYELSQRQTSGHGALISFELKGGLEAGKRVMNAVQICALAVSLGGVETLIQHPASMTHASMGAEARKRAGITDGLVRLSVGIENIDELIADLDAALNAAVATDAVSAVVPSA